METLPAAKKPRAVDIAVNLLWANLAIESVQMLTASPSHRWMAIIAFQTFIISIIAVVVTGLVIFKISTGKNWARITFLVLYVSGVPSLLAHLISGELFRLSIDGVHSVVQACLQGYALYLLFTQPGNNWFRKSAPS